MQQFYRDRRVLITGNTGFKGAWLSVLLMLWGAKVSGYSLPKPPTEPSLFTLIDLASRMDQGYGDIRDHESLKRQLAEFHPELIIHMAAQTLVGEGFRDPWTTFETNIMGTAQLLELVRETEFVRGVIVVTSDKCYRPSPDGLVAFSEEDPLGGDDPYSASKASQELVTHAYGLLLAKHGVGLATARAGNVIGGGDWAENRLVPDVMRSLSRKERVLLRHPLSIRPWQHVLEPLVGYLRLGQMLLQSPLQYSGAWNFGPSGERKTVQDLVNAIRQNVSHSLSVEVSNQHRFEESPHLAVDSRKAQRQLGWRPVWNFETSMRMTVEWYQHWMDGDDPSQLMSMTTNQISTFIQDADWVSWAEVSS